MMACLFTTTELYRNNKQCRWYHTARCWQRNTLLKWKKIRRGRFPRAPGKQSWPHRQPPLAEWTRITGYRSEVVPNAWRHSIGYTRHQHRRALPPPSNRYTTWLRNPRAINLLSHMCLRRCLHATKVCNLQYKTVRYYIKNATNM